MGLSGIGPIGLFLFKSTTGRYKFVVLLTGFNYWLETLNSSGNHWNVNNDGNVNNNNDSNSNGCAPESESC